MSSPNGIPFMTFDEASEMYKKSTESLGCCSEGSEECKVDVQCLRSKTTAEIQSTTFGVVNAVKNTYVPIIRSRKLTQLAEPFAPVIDGRIVSDDPFRLIVNNQVQLNVPILHEKAQIKIMLFLLLLLVYYYS